MRALRNIVCYAFALLVLGLVPSLAQPSFVSANDPAISYVGSWGKVQNGNQASMVTVNSSSQIYVSFTGQHMAGLFDLDKIDCLEQIVVKVDNGQWKLFTIDKLQIEFFPGGLNGGTHRLEVVVKALDSKAGRWLAPLRSAVKFRGFELDPGAQVEREVSLEGRPRLAFLGDSITQGDGIKGTNVASVMNGDALASYAWLAGEALGTTHFQIAFPGQGVLTSDSREVPPAIFSFGWNFAGSAADFSGGPDFLVINLGLNDAGISSSEFVQSYVDLLHEIRKRCPQTIVFAVRPFGGERQRDGDVATAVKMFADPQVHYVDSAGWLDESDFTDHSHLSIAGSKRAAARLQAQLEPYIVRWKSEHR
jgi:lysophospholipase L1-like esterase